MSVRRHPCPTLSFFFLLKNKTYLLVRCHRLLYHIRAIPCAISHAKHVHLCLSSTYATQIYSAVEISEFEWVKILGICEDNLERTGDLAQSYVVSQVTGADRCLNICNNVHGCIGFSLSDAGSCFVTTECAMWSPSLSYITYVRRNVASHLKEHSTRNRFLPANEREPLLDTDGNIDDGCSYCPKQNPCEQPRLCRAGQCFHNLNLKDGTPCDGGDLVRAGDICIAGVCTAVIPRKGHTQIRRR